MSYVKMNVDDALNAAYPALVDQENKIRAAQEVCIQKAMKFRKYLWVFGPKLTRDEAIVYLESCDIFHAYHTAKINQQIPIIESIIRLCACSADGMIVLDDEASYVIRGYI